MGRPQQYYQIGLDLGNGAIKIASEYLTETIPSYVEETCIASDALGSIQLGDEAFCVGDSARRSTGGKGTYSDIAMKTDKIYKLYLGAISYMVTALPHSVKKLTAQIVVSSHAWKSHKQQIKDTLHREFNCKLNGKEYEITTQVLAVIPEGYGAICFETAPKIVTLDFGTGTMMLTPYLNKNPQDSQKSNKGVVHLYKSIAEQMESINHGKPAEIDEIRKLIEDKSFITSDGVDFKSVYQSALLKWWNEDLKQYMREAQSLMNKGYKVKCIGGGVALPGFAEILQSLQFQVVTKRPELASAKGLYTLAQTLASKQGGSNNG